MKNKLIGATILIFGTILFFKTWDNYVDIWYLLTDMPEHKTTTDFLIAIGQGVVYLTLVSTSILFGLSLLRDKKKRKIERLTFATILTLVILLEVPVYNCDLGQSRHSFWYSHKSHFH
ncbi:MAG: hypothetical protein KF803_15015 [Cyclobacteriaceae bacterium]|nr:hypothetical protein [Cyclobacteriaceae bacterium]